MKSDSRRFAMGITALSVAGLALSAAANGALLGLADAHPWSTPAAINFVIDGPGGPQVNVHDVACPAIQVLASTGSSASCEFEISRTESIEPSSVDVAVTGTVADHTSAIEVDKFTLHVVGGKSWGFAALPQVIATQPSWPWATRPWRFASIVSWSDLSNASLGGSVTLVLQIDLTSDKPTTSPTPTPTPTLPDTGSTPTPTPTLPDTSPNAGKPGSRHDTGDDVFVLLVVASVAAIIYLWAVPRRRRRRDA
jgi:hypothetical protein